MLPRSLGVGLLVGACVAAAGAGSYMATLQQARSSTATAASLNSPVTPGPQSVAPEQPASTTATVPGPDLTPSETAPRAAAPSAATGRYDRQPEDKTPTTRRQAGGTGLDIPSLSTRPSRPGDPPSANQAGAATSQAGGQNAASQAGQPGQAGSTGDPSAGAQKPSPGSSAAAGSQAADPARADSEPARDNVKLWEELVVPAESVLGLQLESPLSSDQARVEDRVEARVTRDVRANGRVAIPAGSLAVGSVVLVERGGKLKERARLGIRFNSLVVPDGGRMQIITDTLYRESESPANKASAKIGGAAIGGAILGAIIGGGKGAAIGSGIGAAGGTAAAMSADRMAVVLPAGTTVSVRTQAPITVTVEK